MTPLDEAIKTVGGIGALAARIGVRYQAVQKWRRAGIPEERCPDVERATGVRCEFLRGDVTWIRHPDGSISYQRCVAQPPGQSDTAQVA